MKTSKYLKTIAFCALMLAAAMPGKAQVFPNTYINIDWQVGVPLGAGFADKASGWGMNFEGGYFVTPAITVGRPTRNTRCSSCRSVSRDDTTGLPTAYSSHMRV